MERSAENVGGVCSRVQVRSGMEPPGRPPCRGRNGRVPTLRVADAGATSEIDPGGSHAPEKQQNLGRSAQALNPNRFKLADFWRASTEFLE